MKIEDLRLKNYFNSLFSSFYFLFYNHQWVIFYNSIILLKKSYNLSF